MAEISKFGFVRSFRRYADRFGMALPLPNVNPNAVSGLSVITSMVFVLSLRFSFFGLPLLFLAVTILLDWFDGLIARRYGKGSEEGYFVDLVSDRLSEGIIFSFFFFPWFYLFTLNCMLSIVSVRRKRHVVLPLRHIFMVFYVYLYFFVPEAMLIFK